ncbi:glucitol operon activator protein [Geosporobacter subterraneus DSM 17957]|uniref:Glucitol operon activator protein n=1 Tax=Geosporobacter subterraneus DSM 17957 TaxID=1121919 RepID=A0A1M6IQF6_9FIRM|nr:transcriptional regulator GutM [Geosporobacter subterraneus]SHJ36716.1 glucitol operon activator protein [Geosporobacter subterraneus DSM 17957]
MDKIFVIAFGLLILQGVLSFNQIKNYQIRIKELKKKGLVGIGREKGLLRAGNITILVCNKQGKIIAAEKMEGITVFSRFREIDSLKGMTLQQLKEIYTDKKKNIGAKAMLQAIDSLETATKVNGQVL